MLAGLVRRREAELVLYNKPDAPVKEGKEKMDKANVILYGKPITDVLIINDKTYVAVRDELR
ncbi:hypothetical protein C1I60_22485 [Paenibacillus terrae]|uniref:Uncharacterized protein n=1 Tax=Paenibacillus terrae TaxID=159743 RepID=A0A4U2PYE9_9BACL|nr:hypothetical protein [Paenibacillus terrae]TKH42068.1 hypothetical protein C1I60_22485 [Paenibacillus terrae]